MVVVEESLVVPGHDGLYVREAAVGNFDSFAVEVLFKLGSFEVFISKAQKPCPDVGFYCLAEWGIRVG